MTMISEEAPSLFDGVKFYGIGFTESVEAAVVSLGGLKFRYLSDDVTHVIVGTKMHNDHEVTQAIDLYSAQVVDESWAISSILLHKVLQPDVFSPVAMSFFDGLVVSFTQLPQEDKKRLWFMLSHHGAICVLVLEARCNLLVCGEGRGLKYEKAIKMDQNMTVVTPDWVTDSLHRGKLQPKHLYHPRLIRRTKEETITECNGPLRLEPLDIKEDILPPDLSIFKKSQSLPVKKGVSKFVKANIQFFHSGHGAPPALADRERTKRRDQQQASLRAQFAGSQKSPISNLSYSQNSSSSSAVKCEEKPKKPPRVICLPRKLPLRREGDPPRSKNKQEFMFSVPDDKNDSVDKRVPPECCRRGCRFLVSDFDKFVSPQLLTALKDHISERSFDCSCPCHFLSEDVINDINRQGAFSDTKPNPRIKALLDLQNMVQKIPPAFQNDFIQDQFKSSQSSKSPLRHIFNESTTERTPPSIPKLRIFRDKSPGAEQKFQSKFISKVNPNVSAVYSRYSCSIKVSDGKRIVMIFKRLRPPEKRVSKTKYESRGEWLNPTEATAVNEAEYKEVTKVGRLVNIHWDEKQVAGTEFSAGWYSACVTFFDEENDEISVEHIDEPGKVYKIAVTATLMEGKLRPNIVVDNFSCPTPPLSVKSGASTVNEKHDDPFHFDEKALPKPHTPLKRPPSESDGPHPIDPKIQRLSQNSTNLSILTSAEQTSVKIVSNYSSASSSRMSNVLLTPPSDSAMPAILDEPLVANDILAEDLMPGTVKPDLDLDELLLGGSGGAISAFDHNTSGNGFDSSQGSDFGNSFAESQSHMQYVSPACAMGPLPGLTSPSKYMNSSDLFPDLDYSPPKSRCSVFPSSSASQYELCGADSASCSSFSEVYSTATNHDRLHDYYDPESALTSAESGNIFLPAAAAAPNDSAHQELLMQSPSYLRQHHNKPLSSSGSKFMQQLLEPSSRVKSSPSAATRPTSVAASPATSSAVGSSSKRTQMLELDIDSSDDDDETSEVKADIAATIIDKLDF